MKKNAFTLAEVLITAGIIGIIAAISVPALDRIRPDATKAIYLKSADAMMEAVQSLVNNKDIYPATMVSNNNMYDISQYPLINTGAPLVINIYGNHSGQNKLAQNVCEIIGGNSCNGNTFSTQNGKVRWTFNATNRNNQYLDTVTMEIVDKGTFRFYITGDGNITIGDTLGRFYFEHRDNWKKPTGNVPANETIPAPNDEFNLNNNVIEDANPNAINVYRPQP